MAKLDELDIDGTIFELGGGGASQIDVTASTTWSGSGPYTQTIAATGINANTIGFLSISSSASQDQWSAAASAQIRLTSQTTNQITITAGGSKPSIAIPLTITVLG